MITCKRGHPRTEANTRYFKRRDRPDRAFAVCLDCRAHLARLKYRKDDAFREQEKARKRNNYHARRPSPPEFRP